MPGFNIHLAIAKEYIKNHKNEIVDEKEFFNGTIRPDMNENLDGLCENKSITHYGQMGNKNDGNFETDIYTFLIENKENMSKDFYKGYLLHLLTDYYFYNIYFNNELLEVIKNRDKFHYDFDCINKKIEEIYKIDLPINIKKYTGYTIGKPKYLKLDKVINFINEIGRIDLNSIIGGKEYEKIK